MTLEIHSRSLVPLRVPIFPLRQLSIAGSFVGPLPDAKETANRQCNRRMTASRRDVDQSFSRRLRTNEISPVRRLRLRRSASRILVISRTAVAVSSLTIT